MRILILFFCFWGSQLFADQHFLEQENFEAWQFACVEEQSQKLCDLRELVFDSNTNEVVSYLSITINPEALTQMQIAFPHAVNLKSPVQLQIDDKDPLELGYAYCNQSACFIAEIIAENFINMPTHGPPGPLPGAGVHRTAQAVGLAALSKLIFEAPHAKPAF